jgi:hemerythrin superfamily protein
MNTVMKKLAPKATGMIRTDHSHVVATFHQIHVDTPTRTKLALVNTICLALDIHARLEEEIFYPAMREVAERDSHLVDKSLPEHAEMRRLIGELRAIDPGDPAYDRCLLELMRDVLHHVADEETTLLPDAERLLGDERLSELGARMMKRRLELAAPKSGEIAANMAKSMPASKMLVVTGVVLAGGYIASRAFGNHHAARPH